MAEPMTQQQRLKTHRTPECNQRTKSEQQFTHPRPPQRSAPKDLEQREGDNQVSQGRLTSPNRSPNRNKRSPPHSHSHPQAHVESHQSLSPHKPRKAYEKHTEKSDSFTLESHSPPKGPSPPPTRWAGPAFNNAPPPSSLPLPDFPPFFASSSSQSAQATIPIAYPDPQFYIQPPLYAVPQFSVQFAYNQPIITGYEAQLSMDLRKMLNISASAPQPIPA